MSGLIEFRIFEDFLEITVGSDSSTMKIDLNLSEPCVATLASVFEQALPILRANSDLIEDGRLKEVMFPHEHWVMIGDTWQLAVDSGSPELAPTAFDPRIDQPMTVPVNT
ncbi:hypothetical protein [Actinokineospora sp.]|uniref:hypothetical protein n=1 Tax=Actinokineospora sp. TaxID=1872133 RepID=UPI0040378919